MQFTNGATVSLADGSEAGHITHVVLDPLHQTVTHVVVRQGSLFAEDRVIPVHLFATANPEEVMLHTSLSQLEALPSLRQPHYFAVDKATTRAAYLPDGRGEWHLASSLEHNVNEMEWVEIQCVETEKQNIPPGTVALAGGARVFSADHQHVGNVEIVLTRPNTEDVSHVVIVSGLGSQGRRIVPTSWFQFIEANAIDLGVNASRLEALPRY